VRQHEETGTPRNRLDDSLRSIQGQAPGRPGGAIAPDVCRPGKVLINHFVVRMTRLFVWDWA